MKMMSSTSITSTSGVTLISAMGARRSSRGADIIVARPRTAARPTARPRANRRRDACVRAIRAPRSRRTRRRTWRRRCPASAGAGEDVVGDDGGNRGRQAGDGRDERLGDARRDDDEAGEPCTPMLRNALMIPTPCPSGRRTARPNRRWRGSRRSSPGDPARRSGRAPWRARPARATRSTGRRPRRGGEVGQAFLGQPAWSEAGCCEARSRVSASPSPRGMPGEAPVGRLRGSEHPPALDEDRPGRHREDDEEEQEELLNVPDCMTSEGTLARTPPCSGAMNLEHAVPSL